MLKQELAPPRSIVTVLAKCRHPVSIVTKGVLIARDIDLLAELASQRLASVVMSLTTLDAKEAGASCASYVLLRLPYEVNDLFLEWLAEHYPQRANHVMSLVRDARRSRDSDANFGTRMRCTGAYAELPRTRFKVATRRLGLDPPRDV